MRNLSLTFTTVLSVWSLSASPITPEELADRMEAEVDRFTQCVSYLYEVHTESLSATPKAQGGQGRFHLSTHLFHRKGDRHRLASTWSDRHNNRETAESTKASFVQAQSFDGKRMRYNLVQGGYYFHPKDLYLLTPLESLSSFDRILDLVPEGKPYPPGGSFESPHGSPFDRGGFSWDHFVEAIAFVNERAVPPTPWHEVLRNGTAKVEEASDGLAEVEGSLYGTPDRIAANREVSAASAEKVAIHNRFHLTIDTKRSFRVVYASLTQEGTGYAEMKDVELEQNAENGIWYPKRFFHLLRGIQIIEFELKDISFKPFPDSVFEEIWVDGQEIRDRTAGTVYYMDPTLNQRLSALWVNLQIWVGLRGGPIQPIPRRLPPELGGTAGRGFGALLSVLSMGALAGIIGFVTLWRSYRKQEAAGRKP